MSFSSFISKRLSLRTAGKKRWAPAIIVAVGGIALSLAVMLIAVGVVTGFKHEIKRKIMGFDAQITVRPLEGYSSGGAQTSATDAAEAVMRHAAENAVSDVCGGLTAEMAPSVHATGLLKTDNDFLGVLFKSFGDSYGWNFERENLVEGEMPDTANQRGVMISSSVAGKLGLHTGDKVNVYFFTGGNVRPRKYEISGIYCSNFGEYDNLVAYAPWNALAPLTRNSSEPQSAFEIRGLPENDIAHVAERLQANLMAAYTRGETDAAFAVTNVFSTGAAYFNWLDMLDTNIVVILILMSCVSGFMLISCVLILILERVRMVGILKSLGATDWQTGMIFVRLGARVTASGLLAGNIVGLVFIAIQGIWHVIPLDPESYYLSYVPVLLPLSSWLIINAGAAIFALLLMLLPAAAVSRLEPVKVMRFE